MRTSIVPSSKWLLLCNVGNSSEEILLQLSILEHIAKQHNLLEMLQRKYRRERERRQNWSRKTMHSKNRDD
jgi:hypothetical protein